MTLHQLVLYIKTYTVSRRNSAGDSRVSPQKTLYADVVFANVATDAINFMTGAALTDNHTI